MLSKTKPNKALEFVSHKKMGLYLKRASNDLRDVFNILGQTPSKNRTYLTKLKKISNQIGQLRSDLEDKMFRDSPELPDSYTKIYYGDADVQHK